MKLLRVLILCGLCLSTVYGFSLDRNAFTFTDYDLRLQIEPEQQRLGVRGKITLRNDSGVPQKTAVLQISSSLDWRSIKVNGEPAQFVSQIYTSDLDHTGALSEAVVSLPREVPPRGSVELEIGYEGVVLLDATRLTRIGVPEDKARHSDWDQIGPTLGAVRGIGYVAWYPVATDAASLSDANSVFETVAKWKAQEQGARMRVNFCTSGPSAEFKVITNNRWAGVPGATVGAINHGGPVLHCSEYIFDPVGFTVPTFAVAPFDQTDQGSTSFYFLPGHQQQARAYMQASADVAGFVNDWFGAKPEVTAKVAELADRDAAPYESGTMLLAPAEGIDPKLARTLLVHQLTHSTFHSPRPWIDEGIAHFAQALWLEQQSGRQAALDFMGLHRTSLVAAEKSAGEQKNSGTAQSLITTTDEEYYRSKAMFVWWMLHDMVGDAAFKNAIAAYEPQRDTQPSYVQKLFEKQAHRDLEWFFDDWVYRDRGLPDFRVASAYSRQILNGTYMVTVTVENLGAAGAEVPVRVGIKGGDVRSKVEVRGKSSASVRIEVPSPAQEVTANDGSVPESNTENNAFRIKADNNK
jgi:hypothetical protein